MRRGMYIPFAESAMLDHFCARAYSLIMSVPPRRGRKHPFVGYAWAEVLPDCSDAQVCPLPRRVCGSCLLGTGARDHMHTAAAGCGLSLYWLPSALGQCTISPGGGVMINIIFSTSANKGVNHAGLPLM